MWNETKVNQFIKAYKFRPAVSGNEITAIAALLEPDETPLAIITGRLKTFNGKIVKRNGIIIFTSQRLFIYGKSLPGRITFEQISIPDMLSASFTRGFLFGSMIIRTSGGKVVLQQCYNKSAKNFLRILKAIISNCRIEVSVAPPLHAAAYGLWSRYGIKQKSIINEEKYALNKQHQSTKNFSNLPKTLT